MKNRFSPVVLAAFLALIPLAAHAESFAEKCPDIGSCAKVVGELLGQKYIFDADVKGKVVATPNLELTRENAELLFTEMLNLNGFSRVPLGQANSFQILRQRDARDAAIPSVAADQRMAPTLPDNWDLYTMKYKATHPESVEHMARMCRSFMPANSRIIPDEVTGLLLVTDTALNLRKIYGLLRDLDEKPTSEMRKRWQEEDQERRAEMRMRMRQEHPAPQSPAPAGAPAKNGG